MPAKDKVERFKNKYVIDAVSGCWNWIGTHTDNGYGVFHWGVEAGKDIKMMAHRASYIFHKGNIPSHLMVRHKCDNSKCCNPEHLELGTHAQNMRDRDSRGRLPSGKDHYKWKRTENLLAAFKILRARGLGVDDICAELDCGRNTYYRAVARDPELKEINKAGRSTKGSEAMANRIIENPDIVMRGERNWRAKVTADDVRDIRRMREEGMALKEIGGKYNMTEAAVCSICTRKTWKHVT